MGCSAHAGEPSSHTPCGEILCRLECGRIPALPNAHDCASVNSGCQRAARPAHPDEPIRGRNSAERTDTGEKFHDAESAPP
jgi:hypothetical protein